MSLAKIKSKVKAALPTPVTKLIQELNQKLTTKKLSFFEQYVNYFSDKQGIEIGGASPLFKYAFPIYSYVQNVDGVNFANTTHWEGQIQEGQTYQFYKDKIGYQYISDGTDLSQIADAKYDFVISSNCLEHIANPLKALKEWHRVSKDNGILLLVLPNKASNFDHKRPITKFEHLLEDYYNQTQEDDLTHLEEILELHDSTLDSAAGDIDNFKQRSLKNFQNRYLHHHVFDLDLMEQMIQFVGFDCINQHATDTDFFILACKTGTKIY